MLISSLVAFFVVLLDFVSKYIVRTNMELGESFSVIPGILNFTYVLNKGAAWGMLADKRWIFLSFSVIALVIIAVFVLKYRNNGILFSSSLGLIFGGGVGNMIDRIFNGDELFNGAVVDFIEAAFIDFPVFNIADSAVVVGAVLLMIYILFIDGKNGKVNNSKGK